MGSINCKEYVTTKSDSCVNQPHDGSSDSFQYKLEVDMALYTNQITVCNEADMQENEMRQVDFIEDTKILLIKQNGKINAIGNKCSHYGAPLFAGALGQGRLRCPWHGACFNIETGDIEDFPGLDSIPCYNVQISKSGEVKVSAKRSDLESSKRLKNMVRRCTNDKRTYVIVGGGPSGGVCAETLRQEGFTGRIVMICRECALPYDRVKISKSMDINIDKIQLRNKRFYDDHDIEILLGVEVTKLDVTANTVNCSNGYSIKYEKIFIATGSRASKPPITGANLGNVVTIRDHSDAQSIYSSLTPEMNVVCLGSSFIALEAASYLVNKVKSVTLIGRENVPLKVNFGEKIGQRILKLFQDNGVKMIMSSGITEIIGNIENNVVKVQLKDDVTIPCDLLVMGTGSKYYTDFLKESGVKINDNGSIDTDTNLMTNVPNVYVGGDIANAPVYSIGNIRASIGHYGLAQYHGRIAAINMAGTKKELHAVPFFFTMIFGKGFRYAGYGTYTDVFIEGDLDNLSFAAYFLDDNKMVIAVASCGRDPIVAQFAELQTKGKSLYRKDVEGKINPLEWTKMINSA